MDADGIVVGAGLAGLVATAEIADSGKRVILLDQEGEQSLGGQAFWSFGGLFMVDTPEQRRLRIRDSRDLALRDWLAYAGFDRDEDAWPRRWSEAYVDFAAGEMRPWLHEQGMRWFPIVGWAERRGSSVPRFHITWGTGPAVIEPFVRRVRWHMDAGRVTFLPRHRVTDVMRTGGVVDGVAGEALAPTSAERGFATTREVVGSFRLRASAVVITTGGVGGDHELVRRYWPKRLGTPPVNLLSGVPDYVDGRMIEVAQAAGARAINLDRMWHYPEGVKNYAPIWSRHGIRILAGPSALWIDATGRRLPAPLFPGFDALGALEQIARSGHEHSWFVMDSAVFAREMALSGSEQNPDLTGKSIRMVLQRALPKAVKPVELFGRRGADFVFANDARTLAAKMSDLGEVDLDAGAIERELRDHDAQAVSATPSDAQAIAVRDARRYLGDRLIRVSRPHAFLDPKRGPLVAIRLWILTRKTLGGLETDLDARVLGAGGTPVPGLYAAGEVSGFGGGGMHGYRALEGTFLGGCIFSGRVAGRAAARAV